MRSGARLDGVPMTDHEAVAATERLLQAGEVRPNQVVALVGLAGPRLLAAIAAVWAADAVPHPSSGRPSCGCHVVLDAAGLSATGLDLTSECAETAIMHATSGSSAIAKVARRSVSSVLLEANGYSAGLQLNVNDRVGVPVPVAHSFGSGVALSALLSGCDVHADAMRLPSAVAADVDEGRLNKVAITPSIARLLVKTRRRGLCNADAVLVGAGVLDASLASNISRRFQTPAMVGYGSTETGGTFLGHVGMGSPVPGVDMIWPLIGQQGPLVLRISAPVLGYADEAPRTSRTWRTGDIVVRDGHASARYVRRQTDDRVRVNGVFVDVTPLREQVQRVAGVSEHAFVVATEPHGESLYLVLATASTHPDALARALCWPGPAVQVVTCPSLPRNEIGKLDRDKLTQLVSMHEQQT